MEKGSAFSEPPSQLGVPLIRVLWCLERGSNPRRTGYESVTLPTELSRHLHLFQETLEYKTPHNESEYQSY